jgi:hypothetical protein
MKKSVFIVLSVLLIACSSQKDQQKVHPQFLEISFGSGGGFTGLSNTYLLNVNKQVFKLENRKFTQINSISKADMRNITKTIKEIGFSNLNISEKGDLTYFIEIKTTDSIHKVTWTDVSETPELKEFYKTLVATLKQN